MYKESTNDSCKAYDRKVWHITFNNSILTSQVFEQPKTKIQIGALFGCISDSLQPLAVHSHQLPCVQPNDSGKRNTA